MKNFMIVHKSLYRLFLKLSIVIVNGRLNKNASGKTEKKKNCIKQFSLWACRCLNSLYSVCTGKVNTCIQWSKHFITPLFFTFWENCTDSSLENMLQNWALPLWGRVNQTIIVKKPALLKRMSRWWWRLTHWLTQPSLRIHHHHPLFPCPVYLKELSSKEKEKHKWLNYD